jgi:hypothetical protein
MNSHPNQSQATRALAASQTHHDMHTGRGVIAEPTHDAIAVRAYEIYVNDGRKQGHCHQNWFRAEHELHAASHRA